MIRSLFTVCGLIGLLAGCGTNQDSLLADNDDPGTLLRVAVPGWQPEGAQSVRVIPRPPPAPLPAAPTEERYSLAPALVIKQSDSRLTLFAVGTPSNAQGVPQAGHSSQAIISAYWFEKRGGKWLLAATSNRFAEEGFFGNAGELRPLNLGNGEIALAVANGSCWQGSCGKWLTIYRIGARQVSPVFGTLLSSDSENATAGCGDLLKLEAGRQTRVSADDYSTYAGCYRITGEVHISPSPGEPGQLLIEYRGKSTSGRLVAVARDEPSAKEDGDDDAPSEEYLVTVAAVGQKETYRFSDGKYVRISGKNPNPGI